MGTADFAVPSLQALVEGGYNVVAVVTMPDKPAGRGMKLQASPVKVYAESQGLPILQPTNLKAEDFVAEFTALKPDLGIVVAFRMLPEVIWSMPQHGTINLHGSLLPRYRGAAPIHWSVINGDRETGVSVFRLKHELDTGDVIAQQSIPIPTTATTGEIYTQLMDIGAELLVRCVEMFLSGAVQSVAQSDMDQEASHAPKLTKENTCINWAQSAEAVYNHVRGLNPYPTAWCSLTLPMVSEPIHCKVYEGLALAHQSADEAALPVGTVLLRGRKHLDVVCADGLYRITSLQPAGKKRLGASDFLNGLQL